MKKILPITAPQIKSYANHAHVDSILRGQSELYIPWVCNYYVQLSVPEDFREYKVDYVIPNLFTYAPNLFVSRIERNIAFDIKNGVINFLRYYINNGYYIYTLLEVNQIEVGNI